MQSLTYVIGKDKRNLVDDIQNFKIDFNGSDYNWIQARQYEDGMRQVFVTMKNEDGSPFDLTGCNYWFEGILPDGVHKILDAKHGVAIDPANGQFRFDMPKQAFAVAGSYVQAFFRIMKDGANITTLEFDLQVLADKVISGLIPRDYVTPFEDLYDQLQLILGNADGKLQDNLNEWSKKLQDLFDSFNKMGIDTQTMLQTLQSRIADLEAKIKQDGLFTQAEAETFENKIQEALDKIGNFDAYKEPGNNLIEKIANEADDRGINVSHFGAVGDGSTDDTGAIQAAIDSLGDSGGLIYIPGGTFKITELKVTKPHVRIVGHGILQDGQLTVGTPEYATLKDYYFEIDGITFEYTKLAENNIGIQMQMSRDGIVRNCYFINCDKSLYVPPISTGHEEQHCARWKLHDNTFCNVNYGLYVDRDPKFVGDGYTVGDFNFQNNFLEAALKYHVYAIGIDGLICSGNVCFFPSSSEKSADKMANIHIRMGHYIIISNNSLFEAGTWAIELFSVGQAIIDGNTIAWPGQREADGGIMMTWGAQNNEPQVDNIISNNIISDPTGYGIVIQDNTENVTLLNNRIRNFGSSQHYYGSNPIGHSYAIATVSTAKNNQILNNVMTNNTGATAWITQNSAQTNNIKDNIFNNKPAPVLSVFTSKENLSTWPVNYDVLNVANPQPTTVSHMDDGYEGQELLVRIFDGNTTLISNNHQVLKALTTRKLYVNEAIKFRYSFGQWVEI